MQSTSHLSSRRSLLDFAILSLVMDFIILGCILLFKNDTLTTNLPILTFITAGVLIFCCFLVKLNGIREDNAACKALLKETAREHNIALEAERDARQASQAKYERTQAKLRGRLVELREARRKASQTQAGLRASEAKNRDFIDRLTVCADERDTAVARLIKARAQRSAAREERDQAEEEMAFLSDRLAISDASLETTEKELAVKSELLSQQDADNIDFARSLVQISAQRDAAQQSLDATKAAMAEQGVRISEGAMHMVAQTKTVAELRDLVSVSRDRINYLEFELEVRLRSAASMKAEVVRLTEEVAFLQRSTMILQLPATKPSQIHASATSIKIDAALAAPGNEITGTLPTTPSPSGCGSGASSSSSSSSSSGGGGSGGRGSSHSVCDDVWENVGAFDTSSPAPPSPANADAFQELSSSARTKGSATGIKDDAASATSIDDSTNTISTTLSPCGSSSGSGSSSSGDIGVTSSDREIDNTRLEQSLAGTSLVPASLSLSLSLSNVETEAAPADAHTGAHNRPGKKQRRGHRIGGQTQQGSAKSTKAKRQTLSRYFCSA